MVGRSGVLVGLGFDSYYEHVFAAHRGTGALFLSLLYHENTYSAAGSVHSTYRPWGRSMEQIRGGRTSVDVVMGAV